MNISLRPFQTDDLAGLLTLLQAELPAHDISESQFVRKVLLDANFDPEGAFVARDAAGIVAGFLLSFTRNYPLEGAPDDSRCGWITLFAVRSRRRGVGSQLFDAAESRLRAKQITEIRISPYTPNYWTPGVDEAAYPAAIVFLRQRGYEVASRPMAMAVDLKSWYVPAWAAQRDRDLCDSYDLHIDPISPETVLPLMDFLAAEFPGDWLRHVSESVNAIYSGYRPCEDVWVAISDGEVWGFSHINGDRFGPFGVAASRRGLGVGAALLYRSLESMHRRGATRAWFMWTGDGPAKRVYTPAGFIETNRYSIMVKKL